MADLRKLGLDGVGFLPEIPDLPARLVMSIEGMEGTGKTWLACDAPGPLAFLSGDKNSEGVVKTKQKERMGTGRGEIIPQYFPWPLPDTENTEEIANAMRPVRNQWVKAYRAALRSKVRSVVIDTGGWVFLLIRLARFGTVKIFPQVLAAETNQFMQRLLDEGRDSGKTVIWTHRLKDEYADKTVVRKKNGKPMLDKNGDPITDVTSVKTGGLVWEGFKGIRFEMQMIVRLESAAPLGFGLPLVGTVTKCTPNAMLVGQTFSTDNKLRPLRLPTMASRAFEDYDVGATRKEWE